MMFIVFFINFSHFFLLSNAIVYQTCSEALINENLDRGIFQVQPLKGGNIANISCQIVNDTICTAALDNNAEELTLVNGIESVDGYVKILKYENFEDEDINAFKKLSPHCYQGMSYINHGSAPSDHSALFWDYLRIRPNESPDGICKCFISIICLNTSNPDAVCLNKNVNSLTVEEGLFSVKQMRLPLRTLYLGDTGASSEYAKYKIWKFNCQFKLIRVVVKQPMKAYDCLTKDYIQNEYILTDGDKSTCLNFTNLLHLEIETLRNISGFQVFGEDLEKDYLQLHALNDRQEICFQKKDLLFECKQSKLFNFRLFSPKQPFKIRICEIDIF